MATAKVDWLLLEREYVTSEMSQRELARRYEVSNGTVGQHARDGEWDAKRAAFKHSLTTKTYENVAERWANKRAEITDEAINILLASLRVYSRQLASGDITFQPKDAGLLIRELLTLLGEPTERTEHRVFGVNVNVDSGPISPELLERLGELARGRLAAGNVASPAQPLLAGSRPN